MKTIGFIDHFIDESHANSLPALIRDSAWGREFTVTMAWEEVRMPGKKPLEEWCRERGIARAQSLAEVVESCDCLVVLSPDNPECQERLADLPLRSGKPVYIDKPFTAQRRAAAACFAKAKAHGTPLMSCSSLRFAPALTQALDRDFASSRPTFAAIRGPGKFLIYAIHQLEMLVRAMGTGARRVMRWGNVAGDVLLVDYGDDRCGMITLVPGVPFAFTFGTPDHGPVACDKVDGYFAPFVDGMLHFFKTGEATVPPEETLEIIALVETGVKAQISPAIWVDLAN